MPLTPITRLETLADAILTAVVDSFAAASLTLPERRYVTVGQPAADCDQLVVALERIYGGLPGQEQTGVDQPVAAQRTAVFRAGLLRCAETASRSGPPAGATLNAEGDRLLADSWVLHHGLILAAENHPDAAANLRSVCTRLAVGPLETVNEGGLIGVSCTVEILID